MRQDILLSRMTKRVLGGNMVRCHLGRLMGERKLKIADVARETGIPRSTLTLLYREEATRIEVETIERLCGFFAIAVGELLEYVPSKKGRS